MLNIAFKSKQNEASDPKLILSLSSWKTSLQVPWVMVIMTIALIHENMQMKEKCFILSTVASDPHDNWKRIANLRHFISFLNKKYSGILIMWIRFIKVKLKQN